MSTSTDYGHERTLTALFDTRAAAEKAKADLVAAGLPAARISVIEGQQTSTTGNRTDHRETGFWQSLKDMFVPEEDRTFYAEGLSRGGFLLSAEVNQSNHDRVLDMLDRDGAVNLDEREAQWRKEGWTGANTATGGVAPRATGIGATGTGAAGIGTGLTGTAQTTRAPTVGATAGAGAVVADEVIPIAEERLKVGKRDVSHGRVRLRSYVVEKPVDEMVSLHSERVDVSRRPVDRELGAGENLFVERTIEAEEHAEEAIVAKEARVVEEVNLKRVAEDRTQQIHDTVRRTEVEIDDGRGTAAGLGATGGAAAGGFASRISEHMPVFSSTGTRLGMVDHLEGDRIKLAKSDSPDGQHHYVPLSWVSRVADGVHLSKHETEVRAGW